MIPMILELHGEAANDVDAIDIAKGLATTGEAIADAAGCELIRAKMHTTKEGDIYSVSVILQAIVSSNSIAGNIAKEWKAIADIDVEMSIYTGDPE